MDRFLTLSRSLWGTPSTASERGLRIVLGVVGLAAIILAALLYAGQSRLGEANIRQQVENAATEFQRLAEPLVRRLHSMRSLVLEEDLDLTEPDALRKVRTALAEPLAQVRGVAWADTTGFEQLHLRTGDPQAPWRVLGSAELPFKSPFARWFDLARQVLEHHGDNAPPIVWSAVGESFPDPRTALMASIAWRVERSSGAVVQVAAFAVDCQAVSGYLSRLDLGPDGEVLVLSPLSDRVLKMSPRYRGGITWADRAAFEEQFGEPDDQPLQAGDPARLQRLTLRGQRFVWALRPVTLVDEPLWIGLAIPEGQLAVLQRNRPVLVTLLVAVLVLGVATLVHMARRAGRRLDRLTARPRYSEAPQADLEALIRGGESDTLEFKSTLRWNLKAERAGKEISHACLKSIAAFCNAGGGTLLVGVEDDGAVLGVQADRFPSEDKYLLHFNNLLKEHIGLARAARVGFAVRDAAGGRILVVDCARSDEPVFVRSGDEQEYFVRIGPGTRKLSGDAMLEHIRTRDK